MQTTIVTTANTAKRPIGTKSRHTHRSGFDLLIGVLVLVALIVRLHALGTPNLWLDEANSWYVAHLSWPRLLANLKASPVGPVYFVGLKLWITAFGTSEAALRMPSVLASVLLIPIVYALGVRTASPGTAAIAAVLTALSPLQLYFAQEARMYMLLALLAAACLLAYVYWRDAVTDPARESRGRARGALIAYVVLAILMLGTNVVSAPLLVAVNLDAALVIWLDMDPHDARRPALAGWVAANGLIVLVAAALLLGHNSHTATASQAWRGALGAEGAARAFVQYPVSAVTGVYYYPDELVRAYTDVRMTPGHDTIRHFASLVIAQPLVVAVLVIALALAAREARRRRTRILVLAVFIPLVVGAVISVRRQVDLSRYFLYASAFLFVLVGLGLGRLSVRNRALALACLVGAMGLGSMRTFRVGSRDSDYRSVAAALESGEGQADAVIVQPAEMLEPLAYYLHGRLRVPVSGIAQRRPLGPVVARAAAARVWLVLDYRSPAYQVPPAALRESLDACVLDDRYDAGAGAGVRLVLVARAAGCGGDCATCR